MEPVTEAKTKPRPPRQDTTWQTWSSQRRTILAIGMQAMAPHLDGLIDVYRLRDPDLLLGVCGDLIQAWTRTKEKLDSCASKAGLDDWRDA